MGVVCLIRRCIIDYRDMTKVVDKELRDGLKLTFDFLFQRSVAMLEDYKQIEKWPRTLEKMSISSNHKQKIVKECIYRVFEELCEATAEEENSGKFTEELADASLFFMEMLVILGFNTTESLVELVAKRSEFYLHESDPDDEEITPENFVESMRYYYHMAVDPTCEFSSSAFEMLSLLGRFGNALKNRPWRQTKVLTDESKALTLLADSILTFFGFIRLFGGVDILKFIYMKQKVNEFRIRSNY